MDKDGFRSSFTQDSELQNVQTLGKLKPLPSPLMYPMLAAWTNNTFLELREHGHVDNVSKPENMNTNPAYGCDI